MKKWYAVYTRRGCEKKVADAIHKKRGQAYLPVALSKKGTAEPVFPNLVFINVLESEHEWVKQVPGVLNLFYWLQKPAVIPDVEIEMMRRFLSEHKNVQIQKTAVNVDAIGRMSNESSTAEKELITINGTNSKLVLPSLGYSLLSGTKTRQLEPEKKSYNYPAEFTGKLTLS